MDNDDLRLQAATRLHVGAGSRTPSSGYASLLNRHGGTGPGTTIAGLDYLSSSFRSTYQLGNSRLLEEALASGGGAHLRNLNASTEQRANAGASNAIRQLLEDRQRLEEQQLFRESDHDQLRRVLGARTSTSPGVVSAVLARLQAERALLNQAAIGPSIIPSIHSLIASGQSNNSLPATGNPEVSNGRFQGAHPTAANPPSAGQSATTSTPSGESIHLYMSCDDDDLSPYQCLVRKQIELFEAQETDAETNARGRNRPIVVGQVGIRCKHCKMLPPRKRARAAIYYPSKLDRLVRLILLFSFRYSLATIFHSYPYPTRQSLLPTQYQAGQTMASVHLGQHCQHIPAHIRQELARLREGKSAALGGKKYWSDGARALGVSQEDERLWFR